VGAGLDPAPTRVPFGGAFDRAHDQKGTGLVYGALLDVRTRDASTGRRIPICGDRPPMLGAIVRDFNDAFCS